MGNWTIEEKSRNVHIIRFPLRRNADWEQWVLATSDRHWDHPHSDQKLQYQHLQRAKERGAPCIDTGDAFCVMQGKKDKRGSKGDIRPEHNVDNYFDAVVNTAVDAFKPYADVLAVMGRGNHDTAIIKHGETDLLQRFVYRLNQETESPVKTGGYSGWVRLQFEDESNKTSFRQSVNVFYHHGYGGGGPVTKGVIQASRKAVYVPDAHIVLTGHVHEEWVFPIQRTRLSDAGTVYMDKQIHIQLPGYKEEFQDGYGGFHIEKGRPPKPIGCAWLRFFWNRKDNQIKYEAVLDSR